MGLAEETEDKSTRVSFVNLSSARTPEQLEVLSTIKDKGVCPFCPENLADYHKNPILISGKYWLATENQWPYKNTKYHFLFIHRTHVESIIELTPEEAVELFYMAQKLAQENDIKSGGFCMRFGQLGKNGASVSHLHAHLISVKDNPADDEHVRFKVG